jgi:hypothetical protein
MSALVTTLIVCGAGFYLESPAVLCDGLGR